VKTVPIVLPVALAVAVAILPGARDAEIAAAIKERVEAKKAAGMVVATIEADGTQSMAAYGNPGPGGAQGRRGTTIIRACGVPGATM